MNDFQNEWAIIHSDIEKYEHLSLIIKLFSLLIFTLSLAFSIETLATIFILLILWLEEGIWKTFQQRLESRALFIEQQIKRETDKNNTSFQLYSEWKNNRLGSVYLIKEYLSNSIRPTVAYPYVLMIPFLYFFTL